MLIPNKLNITYLAVTPNGRRFLQNTESNAVTTEILTYSVVKEIRSDKTTVKAGETFHNTVTFTNNSAVKLLNNFFTVPQPDGANYVAGSVKINGAAQPDYNPLAGFFLPDLNRGDTVIIEYDLKVNDGITPATITNFATLDYAVTDPIRGNVKYSENTDTVKIDVVEDKTPSQTDIPPATYKIRRIYYDIDGYYNYGRAFGNCNNCCCCDYCREFYCDDFYC